MIRAQLLLVCQMQLAISFHGLRLCFAFPKHKLARQQVVKCCWFFSGWGGIVKVGMPRVGRAGVRFWVDEGRLFNTMFLDYLR